MATKVQPVVMVLIGVAFAFVVPTLAVHNPAAAWGVSSALLLAFMLISGYAIRERWIAVLIDDRNVVSLSRFQMALWTILILSAFYTAAMVNLGANVPDPLKIGVDPSLWALMGISTTSLVGSPLILSAKASQGGQAVQELVLADGSAARGQVAVNRELSEAKWSDMFTGEDVGNWRHLDLTRIQMFFFTVVTVIAYGADLLTAFSSHELKAISQLPKLDPSLVALIGISHGGYLIAKVVPGTGTAPQAGAAAEGPGRLATGGDADEPAMG